MQWNHFPHEGTEGIRLQPPQIEKRKCGCLTGGGIGRQKARTYFVQKGRARPSLERKEKGTSPDIVGLKGEVEGGDVLKRRLRSSPGKWGGPS